MTTMNILGVEFGPGQLWLLTLAGTALSWFVVQRLALSRDKANRAAAARAAFRSAVFTVVSTVPQPPKAWDSQVVSGLPATTVAFEKAVADLSPYLSASQRRRFEAEWKAMKAHCVHQIPGAMSAARILYDHPTSNNDGMRPREAIERFHTHVANLLSYAQET
jgi:hypothetical protein